MGVKLVSASGGSVEINPPATASNFVATMPAGTGNVVVNGINGALVSGTAQNSTSGTSIDFTGIPSWVKRVTVMFSGVSTNGTSAPRIQLGAGSIETSGYRGSSSVIGSGVLATLFSSGFDFTDNGPQSDLFVRSGSIVFTLLGSNTWTANGCIANSDAGRMFLLAGAKTLSGTLDRVRITTVGGTDTFDAGTINILYE